MGKLIFGAVLLLAAFLLRVAGATVGTGGAEGGRGGRAAAGGLLRTISLGFAALGVVLVLFSTIVVVDAGEVGVRHAFGTVDPTPLLPGIRFVTPWSSVERFSAREEQYPFSGEQVEEIAALSREQMGMTVDVGLRW